MLPELPVLPDDVVFPADVELPDAVVLPIPPVLVAPAAVPPDPVVALVVELEPEAGFVSVGLAPTFSAVRSIVTGRLLLPEEDAVLLPGLSLPPVPLPAFEGAFLFTAAPLRAAALSWNRAASAVSSASPLAKTCGMASPALSGASRNSASIAGTKCSAVMR